MDGLGWFSLIGIYVLSDYFNRRVHFVRFPAHQNNGSKFLHRPEPEKNTSRFVGYFFMKSEQGIRRVRDSPDLIETERKRAGAAF
jgi:hypothetical protein